ncbi:MAG: Dna2/Cas4 domain-containing protein [Bdellovibrionales bacterium]|nr:Dna2/Cas4 domain-containing protein [Bdellovibrionales bacterium]
MKTTAQEFVIDLIYDLSRADSQLVYLLIILVCAAIVIDAVSLAIRHKEKESGVKKAASALGIDGSSLLPVQNYISDAQGLAGRPDAILKEKGEFIPVEYKPLAKKIRDRYVAQLLVYMRLIEEFERKRPPYGYLILGKNKRRVKIENTEEKQLWLQEILDDMRSHLEKNTPVKALPHPIKCRKCTVQEYCEFSQANNFQTNKK